ncbi:MAG TPA: TIGR03936 family radical SAM-associated protein [Candidatus Wallbacteria bacterium]|nr:TIGR03936 family radical SAM-associated protein [Candidatus Wallbacteria bacterium]
MQTNEFILQAWYEKSGLIKYTAHRDVINVFYISLIRAKLPLCYTEGFNRIPRLSFSPALSLGVSSKCEFVNIYLNKRVEAGDELLKRLNDAFPPGIIFNRLDYVEADINKTVEKIKAFEYRCEIEADCSAMEEIGEAIKNKIAAIGSAEKIMVNYNDRVRDIRPYIDGCEFFSAAGRAGFVVKTALIAGSSIKPQLIMNYIMEQFKEKAIYCASIQKEKIIYKNQ